MHQRDERGLGVDVDLVGPRDEDLVRARHPFAVREPGARIDDDRAPAERLRQRAQRLGDVAGSDRDEPGRRPDGLGEDVLAEAGLHALRLRPPASGILALDDDVARAALDVRCAAVGLEEDVDLAAAGKPDSPRLVVLDPVGDDPRELAVEDGLALLGHIRLDAAAGDRSVQAPRTRHREFRAERPWCAPPRRDDRREKAT